MKLSGHFLRAKKAGIRNGKMKRIEFHNREEEITEIMNILSVEPILITFVCGPINSGKTELFDHLAKQLPKDYIVFYINFRGKYISDYSDFIRVLFKVEREKDYKEIVKTISETPEEALRFKGIPVTKSMMDAVFKKSYEDVFEFLEDYFTKLSESRIPVLIVDELQVIKDIKIDELWIYKLFNFFIRLTKELRLCHVFAITSDSLFIEKVHGDAMLHGRCRYVLVDDFSKEVTMNFLEKHGFNKEEKEIAWHYCGGKPLSLVELVNSESREGKAEEMLKIRKGQIEEIVYSLKEKNKKMFAAVLGVLSEFEDKDKTGYKYLREETRFLVEKNILFADPVNKELRAQSMLDLLAIRDAISRQKSSLFLLRIRKGIRSGDVR